MMARVSIHSSLNDLVLVQGLARELSLYLSGISLSGRLGRNGGFERNNSAQTSGILKIHFKAPGEGFGLRQHANQPEQAITTSFMLDIGIRSIHSRSLL